MLSFTPQDEKVPFIHALLVGAIAPRPIALASTIDAAGNNNLSPFSFFNVFSANPPIVVFSPARRVRDNTTKHTLDNISEVGEVVINVVNYDIVQQTSLSSVEYPKGVDEFVKSGLTSIPSDVVKPCRVKESPVQFECKVNQVVSLGDNAGAGNLVICEVVKIHVDEKVFNAENRIDPYKIDLVARMGADYYCRVNGESIFEVEKPNLKLGIGVDAIPSEIRTSRILTGNNLGQLGNVERLPSSEDVKAYQLAEVESLTYSTEQKHLLAKSLLDEGQVGKAWLVLLG